MTENLAAEARRLRTEEGLSVGQIQRRLHVTKRQLLDLLGRRALTADTRDALYKRAVALRHEGWSVNDIALEIGVAKSTAFQWVRHLPLDRDSERARKKREHARLMTDAQWSAHRDARAAERADAHAAAAELVGGLTDRELLLLGAVTYWCEGAKSKPWRPDHRLIFTNSDPVLVELFITFVEAMGTPRTSLRYRVSIHESADVAQATEWWARRLGVASDHFQRPTLKRHNPATTRHNVGSGYRGCLVVTVPRRRDLYWRIEGIMQGLTQCLERSTVR